MRTFYHDRKADHYWLIEPAGERNPEVRRIAALSGIEREAQVQSLREVPQGTVQKATRPMAIQAETTVNFEAMRADTLNTREARKTLALLERRARGDMDIRRIFPEAIPAEAAIEAGDGPPAAYLEALARNRQEAPHEGPKGPSAAPLPAVLAALVDHALNPTEESRAKLADLQVRLKAATRRPDRGEPIQPPEIKEPVVPKM